jgi:hypothetical protein
MTSILASLAGTGLPASLVVDSGGGLHAYWRFSEAIETTERALVESIGLGLARQLDGDPSVRDLPRILRLPGTLNWKLHSPRPVRLLQCRSSQLHLMDLEDLGRLPNPAPSEGYPVATGSRGPAARLVCSRLAAALQRMGLAVRSKSDGAGSVLIIESPCPLCPGYPAQQTPPRAGSAHVTPAGTLKCRRARCAAGPVAAPLGLSFAEWTACLPSNFEAALAVLRHRALPSTSMRLPKLVRGLRPAVVSR